MSKTILNGLIKATASSDHPLQTRLELILTDFEPNGNKQAVPVSEADNIIRTALYTPLKINFDGTAYASHHGAIPVGPIISAYRTEYEGRDVIAAEAVIWNDLYEDVAEHLKDVFSEGIGTSWEIYFSQSSLDANGIKWLQGCEFAGTCIVETPAYGPERTKILAIAERLEVNMPKDENVQDQQAGNVNSAEAATVDEVRNSLDEATNLLYSLWNGLDQLYSTLNEVESQQAEANLDTIASNFAQRIQDVVSGVKSMKDELSSAKAELNTLKNEKAESEKVEKENSRKERLSNVGLAELEDYTFYMQMTDEMFDNYVGDIEKVKNSGKAESSLKENKDKIPEPLNTTTINFSDIVAALNDELSNRGKR